MKKFGKNKLELRGTFKFIEEMPIGNDGLVLTKGTILVPQGDDKFDQVAIEAFGDSGKMLTARDGHYIEVEGKLVGREYEGKYYTSARVYEVKDLPMYSQEDQTPPTGDEPF